MLKKLSTLVKFPTFAHDMKDNLLQVLKIARNMFMRFGIKSVSMDDIARELGISKKTLYTHFMSKKEMVEKVVLFHNKEEQDMLNDIQSRDVNAIEEMMLVTAYVRQMLKQFRPTIIYDLQKYYRSTWQLLESLHSEFVFKVITKNLEKGKSEGLYRKEINTPIFSKFYTSMTFIMVQDPDFIEKGSSLENIYKSFMDYHLHAIITHKGEELLAQLSNNN